jgi:hypothetical protein
MKKQLLVLLIIFTGTLGYAQNIFPKSNTIVITTSDSTDLSEKILRILMKNNYIVKDLNKTSKDITTEIKLVKGDTKVSLNTKIKGAEIILTGKVNIPTQGNRPIEYKGNKGTPIMNAWDEMEKMAKAFGGKLKYETR